MVGQQKFVNFSMEMFLNLHRSRVCLHLIRYDLYTGTLLDDKISYLNKVFLFHIKGSIVTDAGLIDTMPSSDARARMVTANSGCELKETETVAEALVSSFINNMCSVFTPWWSGGELDKNECSSWSGTACKALIRLWTQSRRAKHVSVSAITLTWLLSLFFLIKLSLSLDLQVAPSEVKCVRSN